MKKEKLKKIKVAFETDPVGFGEHFGIKVHDDIDMQKFKAERKFGEVFNKKFIKEKKCKGIEDSSRLKGCIIKEIVFSKPVRRKVGHKGLDVISKMINRNLAKASDFYINDIKGKEIPVVKELRENLEEEGLKV